jgi:hypothetical protein
MSFPNTNNFDDVSQGRTWIYIQVKYANQCCNPACGEWIEEGEHAYWRKGTGIRCLQHQSSVVSDIPGYTRSTFDSNFENYILSKEKRIPLYFPFCQKCGNSNDVPAVKLCERCEVEEIKVGVDTNLSRARKIVRQFRSNPTVQYVTYTPGVISALAITNDMRKYEAVRKYGIKKAIDELDGKLIDRSKRGNELFEVDLFQPRNAKILRYSDPSTGEIYADFVPEEIESADAAMAWKFYLTDEEYDGLEVEA